MNLCIHSKFMESWAKLKSEERKQVEQMMRRIVADGITSGMRPHQIVSGKDSFLSLSPNMDLRVLCWRDRDRVVLLHVDHHDAAYSWAERHSAQVSIAEIIAIEDVEVINSSVVNKERADEQTFQSALQKRLENSGIPTALQRFLCEADSDDGLLELLELVAPEWQQLILDAVLGMQPTEDRSRMPSNIWICPDDLALQAALTLPLSQWRIYLHPKQKEAIDSDTTCDIVVSGGPGTGKTVCLLHRAVRLARQCHKDDECVLLVGHSPKAVERMRTMARELAGKDIPSLHFADMIAIGRDGKPRDTDVFGPEKAEGGFLRHLNKKVTSLLIDEAQDVSRSFTKAFIFGRRPSVLTHLTVAVDFNQNIFSDNTEYRDDSLITLLNRARNIHLEYSYRIPREAGLVAQKLIASISRGKEEKIVSKLRETAKRMTFGFSSDFVKMRIYDDLVCGLREAIREKSILDSKSSRGVAVIFCGTSAIRNSLSLQLEPLGELHTPRSVKGDEFDYCILIAPEMLIVNAHNREDMSLQSVYVALSRCRRGVTIFTSRQFASLLTHPAIEIQEIDQSSTETRR